MRLDLLKTLNAERAARRAVLPCDWHRGERRAAPHQSSPHRRRSAARAPRRRIGGPARAGWKEVLYGKVFITADVLLLRLVITGAVHISQALAPMASLLGYDVVIVDPRTAFATPERFPDVKLIPEWPDVALPPSTSITTRHSLRPRTIRRLMTGRLCMCWRATASTSARWARGKPMAAVQSDFYKAWAQRGGAGAHSRADRARHRARSCCSKSPSPFSPRSRDACACRRSSAHEVRRVCSQGRRGRDRGALDPVGTDWCSRRATHIGPKEIDVLTKAGIAAITVARSSPATCPRTKPPVRSQRPWPGRGCGSIQPSPAAPTCLPRPAACARRRSRGH